MLDSLSPRLLGTASILLHARSCHSCGETFSYIQMFFLWLIFTSRCYCSMVASPLKVYYGYDHVEDIGAGLLLHEVFTGKPSHMLFC